MENTSNIISLIFGIIILIINIVLAVNIIKAGKYSKLTYDIIRLHIEKMDKKETLNKPQETNENKFTKNIHEIWNEIQNESK